MDGANALAMLALFGWAPVALVLFALLPPRKAVVATYLGAWLILPEFAYNLPGLPPYSKMLAAAFGVLFGVLIFDTGKLLAFRPKWFDIPIFFWCVLPFISSHLNEYGAYDGISEIFKATIVWLLPYLYGRMYFSTPEGMVDLAVGTIIGAILYVPLCLYEVRMSPQIHYLIYGFYPTEFVHLMRGGGFKPMVFLHGGLVLSMFMGGAALMAMALWRSGAVEEIWKVHTWIWMVVLGVTLILCKSWASLLLTFGAVGLFFVSQWLNTRLLVIVGMLIVPVYLVSRVEFRWDGIQLEEFAAEYIGEGRADSLHTRLANEHRLVEKIMDEKPWFGFAGWGDYRIINERGEDTTIVDSRWVIALGENGVVGMTTLFTIFLLPLVKMTYCVQPRKWFDPLIGPCVGAAMVLLIFAMDRLLNAHDNPIPVLIAGGLVAMPWKAILIYREQMQRQIAQDAIDSLPWGHTVYPRGHRARSATPGPAAAQQNPGQATHNPGI